MFEIGALAGQSTGGGGGATSTNQEAAKRFLEFVKGPEGQEIMQRYGFTLPN